MHDARDVIVAQAPGTHAAIAADGVHLELRRSGARVIEVLDLQGLPALRLDARGPWARTGAPILSVLSIRTGAPDPSDPAWVSAGHGDALRFHYPGTHGEALHRWRVPLRVDGRRLAIEGAVEGVARPSLAWPVGAVAAVLAVAALVLVLPPRRRASYLLFGALAVASRRHPATPRARPCPSARGARSSPPSWRSSGSPPRAACAGTPPSSWARWRWPPSCSRSARRPAHVLRHGVIVTTIDPGLERALVVGGLAFAAGVIAAAARAWWPTHEHSSGSQEPAQPPE